MPFELHLLRHPFAQEHVLFSLAGFKGNLSRLDILYIYICFFSFSGGAKANGRRVPNRP